MQQPCPESALVELVDKDGKVVQTLNNSAGEYSIMQQIPITPPDPQRLMLYVYTNETVEIACPGLDDENNFKSKINRKYSRNDDFLIIYFNISAIYTKIVRSSGRLKGWS